MLSYEAVKAQDLEQDQLDRQSTDRDLRVMRRTRMNDISRTGLQPAMWGKKYGRMSDMSILHGREVDGRYSQQFSDYVVRMVHNIRIALPKYSTRAHAISEAERIFGNGYSRAGYVFLKNTYVPKHLARKLM